MGHPGIVAVYEASQIEGQPYLAREFVDGPTLADRLATGPLPPFEAAALAADMAEALDAAHRAGVVHRDVKPSNILIDAEGRPRLADFGLARRLEADVTLTADHQVLGTPAYMSPEQAVGESRHADARSDIYALGTVLYHALAGEPPFRGTPTMVIHQLLNDDPRPIRSLNERVPRDLETVCLKAMAREPADRYPTSATLAEDLHRAIAGLPVRAHPIGPVGRLLRRARRRPRLTTLVVVLVIAVVSGVAGVLWQWQRAEVLSAEARRQAENRWIMLREAEDAIRSLIRIVREAETGPPRQASQPDDLALARKDFEDLLLLVENDRDLAPEAIRWYRLQVSLLGHTDPSGLLPSLRHSRAGWERYVRDHPDDLEALQGLAWISRMIARVHNQEGRIAEAWPHLLAAIDLLERADRLRESRPLDAADPLVGDKVESHTLLGVMLRAEHREEEAVAEFIQARDALLDASSAPNLDEAERRRLRESLERTLARLRDARHRVAKRRLNAARALRDAGRLAEADPLLHRDCVEVWEHLAAADPGRYRHWLFEALMELGKVQDRLGRPSLALASYRRARRRPNSCVASERDATTPWAIWPSPTTWSPACNPTSAGMPRRPPPSVKPSRSARFWRSSTRITSRSRATWREPATAWPRRPANSPGRTERQAPSPTDRPGRARISRDEAPLALEARRL